MKIKVKILVQKESTFLTSVSWSESSPGGTQEYWCCTHAQPEKHKKGVFLGTERNLQESRLGVKTCLLKRKRVFLNSIRRGI